MDHDPRLHHERVLVDQSELRQRQRALHACHEQSLPRLSLELPHGLPGHEVHSAIEFESKVRLATDAGLSVLVRSP